MKRLIVNCLVVVFALGVWAQGQGQQRFSPEKFQADMEQYIAKEAGLTPREAAAFFPMFREMQKKQRALYNQMMAESKIKPADEKACKKVIQKRDQVELELKSIQQTYHNKFLSVLPASTQWVITWVTRWFALPECNRVIGDRLKLLVGAAVLEEWRHLCLYQFRVFQNLRTERSQFAFFAMGLA